MFNLSKRREISISIYPFEPQIYIDPTIQARTSTDFIAAVKEISAGTSSSSPFQHLLSTNSSPLVSVSSSAAGCRNESCRNGRQKLIQTIVGVTLAIKILIFITWYYCWRYTHPGEPAKNFRKQKRRGRVLWRRVFWWRKFWGWRE